MTTTPPTTEPAAAPPAETAVPAVEVLTVDHFKDLLPKDNPEAAKDPHFVKFLETMNDAKLSPGDRATSLYKLQSEVLQAISEKSAADFAKMNEDWQKQVSEDKEIGGANLQGSLAAVGKLVDKYGSPELRDAMDLTGAGNHPAFVKMMVKIAKDLNEPGPDTVPVTPASTQSLADRLFPKTAKG